MQQVISIVIPVFNSSLVIKGLNRRILNLFESEIQYSVEIIYIDDASTDDSWNILAALQKSDSRIKVIQLLRNSGQHLATFCGLNYAKGDLILTMDDDLQHPPEEIPKLIEFLTTNPECDVVFGIPKVKRHSWVRALGSRVAMKLIDISVGKPKNINLSSFRLMRRVVATAILNYKGHSFTIGSLICYVTARLGNVYIEHHPRQHGKSNYNFSKLLKLALSNIFNHTILPLYIISYFGLVTAFLSFIYFVVIIFMKLTGAIHQAGFASIAGILSFCFGLILLSFGIIGAYVIRISKSISHDRKFIVRQERGA